MPSVLGFKHLPLLLRQAGAAKLGRPGKPSPQTTANRADPVGHSDRLNSAAANISRAWTQQQETRGQGPPDISTGIPVLLQVDTGLELDDLRSKFAFEIVSEQEDGFVIVASADTNLTALVEMINQFGQGVPRGSAVVAQIHHIADEPNQSERVQRILDEALMKKWPLEDDVLYVVDIGVECLGSEEIPREPKRGKRDSDASWAHKQAEWSSARARAYDSWDDIKRERESRIEVLVAFYEGAVLDIVDREEAHAVLPDSFTVRVQLVGRGLRDLILNLACIFEVVEPDDIECPEDVVPSPGQFASELVLLSPGENAPAVCVIDSGIQEGHVLLDPGMDKAASRCFLPDRASSDVGDYVHAGGHGTRVAGAVLFGESVPREGAVPLKLWIQNARVLDENCGLPLELFPPALMRKTVEAYHYGPRGTRLFNHSVNSRAPCRTRHMSSWAAEIDALSEELDVLIVQSSGNLCPTSRPPSLGVRDHLAAGREYPDYLTEHSSRVANPAQSLQALTVGSVAYGLYEDPQWRSFATEKHHASAFSRTGFGIWGIIKPEVVELGGDYLRTANDNPDVSTPAHARECYPELVRSTMYPPGPAVDRDVAGTSFAAPKVTRVAAHLQAVLPDETCLLYRALIVQSARWPAWAKGSQDDELTGIVRRIGYGVPDLERASTNSPWRTTLIASRDTETGRELRIKARECHVFQVPIPESMRRQGDEFDIRIEATLSYAAQPRRTRRNNRRYLSTWVDWKSSRLGESVDSFRSRALKEQEEVADQAEGNPIKWTLHFDPRWGVPGVKRSTGTVQKDWAIVKSNSLPDSFCIGVVGHPGWSKDPDSTAKYALAVSLEVEGREIEIYEDMRVAVEQLQLELGTELEATVEVDANTSEA